jgi:HD-GYP domain-containing protein (c-di-GMP phosphodiesterase class II)
MSDTNIQEAPPSVLHQLNQSNRRLELLLQNLRNERNAEGELREIARDVIDAVALNPDIALATIFLSQIAGTYAVRHCIETAVVTVVMARCMDKSAADTLTVAAAALTMNVGMLRHHEGFQNKNTPLSNEEMAIVRRHPEESADLLKRERRRQRLPVRHRQPGGHAERQAAEPGRPLLRAGLGAQLPQIHPAGPGDAQPA